MFDKLAYTMGAFLGDGSLYSGPFVSTRNGKTYYHNDVIWVGSDIEVLQKVQLQIEEGFGKRYNMQTRKLPSGLPHYVVTAHRREVFDFFSVNTAMRASIPDYYFSAERETKLEICRGLIDTDGYCSEFVDDTDKRYEVKRWQVGFCGNKLELVQGMARLMQSLGVKVGKISAQDKGAYRDVYDIKFNPRSFQEAGMSFCIARKQAKFDRYVEHVLGSETLRTTPATSGEDIVRLSSKDDGAVRKTAPSCAILGWQQVRPPSPPKSVEDMAA